MRPLLCTMASLALVAAARAEPAPPRKLTFEQAMQAALRGPKVRMAGEDKIGAAARVDEADAARYPRIKGTAFGTISPEIKCKDPACTITDPTDFALRFHGFYGSASVEVTQPIYTFGKIDHARKAARLGLEAQKALVDEAAGDVAVDLARAYWGVKLSRELRTMLAEGITQIDDAVTEMNKQTGVNAPTVQDRQRVAVLLAEAKAQRADAQAGEQQALAGLKALVGPDGEVDDTPMDPVKLDRDLGTPNASARPQAVAATKGATAADELAKMQRAYYFPDFAIVGSAVIAGAQGTQNPPSAYAYDPYNKSGAGAVLAIQWVVEPWNVKARTDRAAADARKAHALSDLAAAGASYEADTALGEAIAARDKVRGAADGEKAGRAWVASVLQGQAIGVVEARDLADAYIAWFQMRARWLQAVYQWNVAVVRLARATGEFHANGYRP